MQRIDADEFNLVGNPRKSAWSVKSAVYSISLCE